MFEKYVCWTLTLYSFSNPLMIAGFMYCAQLKNWRSPSGSTAFGESRVLSSVSPPPAP